MPHHDIFISYSRKDSTEALSLRDRLVSSGYSVWVDQGGIRGAEEWATSIAEAIHAADSLLLLLSPDSVASKHVLREVTLALERSKRIIPVEIAGFTALPANFEYPLAGLQRVQYSDFAELIRSIGPVPPQPGPSPATSHGRTLHGAGHGSAASPLTGDRSLLILPFEDLSPDGSNGWFADGLASEMIAELSAIAELRVIDWNTSKRLRQSNLSTQAIARELSVGNLIEGVVRKFQNQIKITISLVDAETSHHRWTHTFKGEFSDIFEIQERIAEEITERLRIAVSAEQREKLATTGTASSDAYELYLRGNEHFQRHSREHLELAKQIWQSALEVDPHYALVYRSIAHCLVMLYRDYERDPGLLDEAELYVKKALEISPHMWSAYHPMALIYRFRGKLEEAEQAAQTFVLNAPESAFANFSLGFFYMEVGRFSDAILPFTEAIKLQPDINPAYVNLCYVAKAAGREDIVKQWTEPTLQRFKHLLRLWPNDENSIVNTAAVLLWAGRVEEATSHIHDVLPTLKDPNGLYNLAYLLSEVHEYESALDTLHRSLQRGFSNIERVEEFLNSNAEQLRELPKLSMVQELLAQKRERS